MLVQPLLVRALLVARTLMLHHESPAGRSILGAAVLQSSIEVERLGAHVEHEEEGRARQPHAQQLHERVQQAWLG